MGEDSFWWVCRYHLLSDVSPPAGGGYSSHRKRLLLWGREGDSRELSCPCCVSGALGPHAAVVRWVACPRPRHTGDRVRTANGRLAWARRQYRGLPAVCTGHGLFSKLRTRTDPCLCRREAAAIISVSKSLVLWDKRRRTQQRRPRAPPAPTASWRAP